MKGHVKIINYSLFIKACTIRNQCVLDVNTFSIVTSYKDSIVAILCILNSTALYTTEYNASVTS